MSVIDDFDNGNAAWKLYKKLRREDPSRELYIFHSNFQETKSNNAAICRSSEENMNIQMIGHLSIVSFFNLTDFTVSMLFFATKY